MSDRPKLITRTDPIAEAWREEGRREVLREIAKMDPLCGPYHDEDNGSCHFCFEHEMTTLMRDRHKPDCLWLRAQAVKA